jgi:hypothetical protein
MAAHPVRSPARRRIPWWVLLGGPLLACLYVPTLATRFDFIDDGNLVYPADPMPLGQRVQLVWQKIQANQEDLGPFRPVLWCHWEAEAELLGANDVRWRAARLVWTALAACALLWLLREMGICPWAALPAAALAMWNPYRNEIWTSLTLSEGVAMPYALMALVCAIRAARSSRAWPWDLAGIFCALAAMGCKNTFAALVPAQVFLRIAPDGRDFLRGVRRNGWPASLLTLSLLLPVIHFIYFKLHWRPGQYVTQAPSWIQLQRLLRGVLGAISLDFVGIGLASALAVLAAKRFARNGPDLKDESRATPESPTVGSYPVLDRYRAALIAGSLLLIAGIAAYLPMDAVSGRYTMPAVWGLDLMIAAVLGALLEVAPSVWRRLAYTAFLCGLVLVASANVGRQQKFASRAEVLWNSLEWAEEHVPDGACVAWQCGPTLNEEEGIHFAWHLQARGRKQLSVVLLDEQGKEHLRSDAHLKRDGAPAPTLLVTGTPTSPGNGWHMLQSLSVPYWMKRRTQQCYVWSASPGDRTATIAMGP